MGFFHKVKKRLARWKDGFSRYSYPPERGGWVQRPSPVIGSEGDYFDPYVLQGTDYVFVSNRTRNWIARFRFDEDSMALVDETPVLLGVPGNWDETVNRGCPLLVNGTFYCWYVGQKDGKSAIGLATSQDGLSFERTEKPVLVPELPFEKGAVMNPCVLFYEGRFHMWYSAGDNYEPDVIGYAESEDGRNWKKREEPVFSKGTAPYDKAKVGGCEVVKTENGFDMYYIGYETVHNARICLAHSKNGIDWEREESNPILSPRKGAWNKDAVYKPALLIEGKRNKAYLFFNGRNGNRETIGVACKDLR